MSDASPGSIGFDAVLPTASTPERTAQRLFRLQNLALALTGVGTVEQAADVVITEGFAALNASAGAVYLRDLNQDNFSLVRAVGYPSAPAEVSVFPLTNVSNLSAPAALIPQPLFLETSVERSRYAPSAVPLAEAMGALVILPLLVDDHALGWLELDWQQEQSFDADTRAFMQVVAQMCAQAMERARLYEAEQAARHAAEQANERMARLQSVLARLTQAVSVAQVGDVIIEEGAAALGAHRGVLALLNKAGDHLEVAEALGYAPENARAWQRFSLEAPIPLADVVRRRQPVWLHDLRERDTRYPQLAQIQTTSQAYAVLPLMAEERVLGGISFGFNHPRQFDDSERAFIVALAQQCAQALERARLYDVAASRLLEIETLNTRLKRAMAETHHRVKNNLQVISALVELQTEADTPLVPADALKRIGGHSRALATLHDLLTDQAKTSFEITTISTRALCGKIIPVLQATAGECVLHAHIDDIRLPVRIGASLCLLVNELVSNAVKHGGHDIHLSLQQEGDRRAAPQNTPQNVVERRQNAGEEPIAAIIHLIVEDDGPGFPPDFDLQQSAHTGLDLVSNLSRLDLGGIITCANNPQGGARVTITFPLPVS